MYSVTQRIGTIKQPRGGYLNPKSFKITQLDDGVTLFSEENSNPSIVGMAVDYLTRFMLNKNAKKAFDISLQGAINVNEVSKAMELLKDINDTLDDKTISVACKLSGYDVAYRAGPSHFVSIDTINPDQNTIANIRVMVNRGLSFLNAYGPLVKDEFTFEGGGYTDTVSSGDGDYLTKDTLWDFKVSKKDPLAKHTLQLLMYYIMGKHSHNVIFSDIKNIGIFNPRLNRVYQYEVTSKDDEIIKEIERDVICYK